LVLGFLFFFFFLFLLFGPAWGMQYRMLGNSSQLNVGDTLVSQSGHFELGIFQFGNRKYYLAIRYAAPIQQTPVWVANRDQPLTYSNSFLSFSAGNLQLFAWNQNNVSPVWSSNTNNVCTMLAPLQSPHFAHGSTISSVHKFELGRLGNLKAGKVMGNNLSSGPVEGGTELRFLPITLSCFQVTAFKLLDIISVNAT
jgi:hypothetical protein